MNRLLMIITVIILAARPGLAQQPLFPGSRSLDELPVVYLSGTGTLHFISPEPIQYADVSVKAIVSDLPLANILRIRYAADSSNLKRTAVQPDAVITIAGEKFIAQYHIISASHKPETEPVRTEIEILPGHCRPLELTGLSLSTPELKNYGLRMIAKPAGHALQSAKAYGLKASLNHVYTAGDMIFLDLGFKNETNLKYDIDQLSFSIEDKKVTKATTVQTLAIQPAFRLFNLSSFKTHYRNIFVFKKFSFPGNKVLHISLNEKQFSGRVIDLKIPYSDILEADVPDF